MNHFTKKNTFAGGGGEPARQKIKAGTLRAPNLGNFDIAGSYVTDLSGFFKIISIMFERSCLQILVSHF